MVSMKHRQNRYSMMSEPTPPVSGSLHHTLCSHWHLTPFNLKFPYPPLPQPFTFLFKIFSKKSPFIFVSYLLMPYFCIRFPRDGQHLILTCCNGVGPALQNNKNNFLFIWIIIIKVVIFAVRFAERGPLAVFSFPFAQRGLEIKDGH